MLEAIQAKSVSIASINLINPDTAKAILTLVIADLLEFLNVGMTMSVNQVQMTVELILRDNVTKNLKPEDFRVCFDQFKKSGKSWNRVDGQTIFEMVYKYAEERMEFSEIMAMNEHSSKKDNTIPLPKEVLKMYKDADMLRKQGKLKPNSLVAVNIKLNTEKEESPDGKIYKYKAELIDSEKTDPRPKKVIEKSPRDIFIQEKFKEFFWIREKNPVKDGNPASVNFAMIDGVPMDETEYVKAKLKEYDQK